MNKLMMVIIVALFLVICSSGSFAEAPKVKIGAILPLSGNVAQFGVLAKNGLMQAIETLPPEDRARLELIIEDDALEAARAVSAARKLVDVDKVDVLVTWSSGTSMAAVGITEAKKIPLFAIASDPMIVKGKKYAFIYWALPEREANTLTDLLVAQGKKRIALITLTHNGALAIRDAVVEIAKTEGKIEIVFNEEVPGTVTDFRSLIGKLKKVGNIDAIIPTLFPGQLALAIKQMRQLGLNAPFYGFETFDDPNEIAAAEGHMKGAIFATGADPTPEFTREYQRRFPGQSAYTASNSYDVIQLIARATAQAKDSATIVKYLESIKDMPMSSGIISATDDHRFVLPTVLKIVGDRGVSIYEPTR
jgi:branched-chain amino acid transport system substrate-binding protein